MGTQLSNSCGWEVSEWWCPFTDLMTYFVCIGLALLLTGIIFLITKKFSKNPTTMQPQPLNQHNYKGTKK